MSRKVSREDEEFGLEPVRGLPQALPPGEVILWQGQPSWGSFARYAFRLGPVAAYFAVLAAWRAWAGLNAGDPLGETLLATGWVLAAGGFVVLVAGTVGWYAARTTCYTITNRRVAFRIGMALTVNVQVPFMVISSADLRMHRDGTGDISISVLPPSKVSWLMFWPHTRPWRLSRPQPSFRNLPDAERAAQVLARALAASAEMPAPQVASGPLPAGAATHGAATHGAAAQQAVAA